jgi:uncharacterized iron-regulated protein
MKAVYMKKSSTRLDRANRCRQVFVFAIVCWAFASTAQSHDTLSPKGTAQIWLMGEIHDNAHGHQWRLAHVTKLIDQGLRPVLVMEQFDRENQAVLDLALTRCPDVDCVLAKAATPGWDWRFYRPFVQWALDKKVILLAANLSTVDVRKVMTDGFSAVFTRQAIDAYKLHQIPPELLSAQNKAIQEGHCNMLPVQAIGAMVKGQIARDVWMASLVNNVQNQTVVLIAGNGHVRKDAGVFQWLSPEKKRITQVHGYVERVDKSDADWFDHVHTVPEVQREDPCLVFTRKPDRK